MEIAFPRVAHDKACTTLRGKAAGLSNHRSFAAHRPVGTGLVALLALFAIGGRANGQELLPRLNATQMIEQARDYYGTKVPLQGCDIPTMSDEIVVCGHRRPDPRYEEVAPQAPTDMKAVAFGAPPMGGGVGAGVAITGCFLQKCPKKLYFIDLKAIPEPSPGTEADLIAKGQAPAH